MKELAYYIRKYKEAKREIKQLKEVIKKQDHEIQDLSILLGKRIQFKNEMRKRKW